MSRRVYGWVATDNHTVRVFQDIINGPGAKLIRSADNHIGNLESTIAQRDTTIAELRIKSAEENTAIGEFQNWVHKWFREKYNIEVDGSGCDSGDWRDLTKDEIQQGVSSLQERYEATIAEHEKTITQRDATIRALEKAYAVTAVDIRGDGTLCFKDEGEIFLTMPFAEAWEIYGDPEHKQLRATIRELEARVAELEKRLQVWRESVVKVAEFQPDANLIANLNEHGGCDGFALGLLQAVTIIKATIEAADALIAEPSEGRTREDGEQ